MSSRYDMRARPLMVTLALTVFGACFSRAEGRWTEPTNGWDLVYAASNGVLPEAASPAWGKINFAAGAVSLVTDELTGGYAVQLVMTSAVNPTMYGYYKQDGAAGRFTTNDLMTCDFRFRLTDETQANATVQLHLAMNGPRPDGVSGRQLFYAQFSRDRIRVYDNAVSNKDYLTPLGTGWHTVRWLINWNTREAKLYLDRIAGPVLEHRSMQDGVVYNYTSFGDGSGSIAGQARVSDLRLTHGEWVEPLTLLHEGDTDPASEGWSYEHNTKSLFFTASNGVLPEASTPVWVRENIAAGAATIVADELTGENALQLVMTNASSPYTYGVYKQTGAEGTFATNQLTTCRMRFRLADETQADSQAQFMCGFNGPRPDGVTGRQMFYVSFAKDRIRYYNNSSFSTYAVALGTNWHDLVWTQDWRTRQASFYLDGSSTPAFSHQSLQDAVAYNFTTFGDGSSGIQGIVRVSSFHLLRQGVAWSGGSEDGTNYWEGVDIGTSLGYYFGALPSSVIGHADGWTASARVRAVEASTPLFAATMIVQDQDSTNRWSMMFTPDECYYYNAAAEAVSLGAYVRPNAPYHIVQMRYDPSADGGNGAVSYYDDGWLKGTVTRAETFDAVASPRLQWGSVNTAATSVQRWSWVEFATGNRVIAPLRPNGTLIMLQ